MKVCSTIEELFLDGLLNNSKTVGFVPTMGALHNGHLSLIKSAAQENDIVICSIFVNPKQFNNAEDLKLYPRNLNLDIELLNSVSCDVLFAPSIETIYPNTNEIVSNKLDLGALTCNMEAAYRPGHFDGVITVVKRLFEIVKPTNAYFGEKDYQQLCVVKALTLEYNFNINVIGCPIVREDDGLAMSSRNVNLTSYERNIAALIPKNLMMAKKMAFEIGLTKTKLWVENEFSKISDCKLEYFEFANGGNLNSVSELGDFKVRAFIAVIIGKTRLIDNVAIN